MRWRKPDGTEYVLVHHTPQQWGDIRRLALLNLGCSGEYASKVRLAYHLSVKA